VATDRTSSSSSGITSTTTTTSPLDPLYSLCRPLCCHLLCESLPLYTPTIPMTTNHKHKSPLPPRRLCIAHCFLFLASYARSNHDIPTEVFGREYSEVWAAYFTH
jgi:hypothetical protein